MDLTRTMELAGRNLLNCLSPPMNFQPYWAMRMDVDYRGEMVFFGNIHNLGRWWDAMLRLEAATGFEIPAHLEAAMLANLRESFDNPDHLCLPAFDHPWLKPTLDFHSLRESLLALNALVRFRGSRWAQRAGSPDAGDPGPHHARGCHVGRGRARLLPSPRPSRTWPWSRR